MGKQINFYIDSDTERNLIEFIFDSGYILLEENRNLNEVIRIRSIEEFYDKEFKIQYFIYKEELGELIIRKTPYDLIEIDRFASQVIELDRPRINHVRREVHRGRLWFETQYWNNDSQLIKKPEALTKAFNGLSRWIIKNAPRREYTCGEYTLKEYMTNSIIELNKQDYRFW